MRCKAFSSATQSQRKNFTDGLTGEVGSRRPVISGNTNKFAAGRDMTDMQSRDRRRGDAAGVSR